jgi:4-amino-4-deoxy-L-arabinose transferase-like glycosyltransferase
VLAEPTHTVAEPVHTPAEPARTPSPTVPSSVNGGPEPVAVAATLADETAARVSVRSGPVSVPAAPSGDVESNGHAASEPAIARGPTPSLTLAGLGLAAAGELYLQFAGPTNRVKAIGVAMLLAGAILFALGAAEGLLPARFRRVRLPSLPPPRVFGQGPPRIAAAVGSLAFVTLIVRLLVGSTAGSDLVLWVAALTTFAMPIVGDVTLHRPSRERTIEIGSVVLIALVFIVLCSWDINDWYYSAIGDEYAFLSQANGVLQDGIKRPFVQDGVYSAHPMLGTIWQAAVMAVFGRNHFGWVFSSVLSAALAIPAVYLVGRSLAGRGVGLIAASIFASSHYLFAFSHIGYNNIMAPTPVAWAIACVALCLRRPRGWLLYASGVTAGLGFYTFYSARAAMPILALFILAQYGWRGCFSARGLRDRLLELWPLLLGFVLAAAPIFAASGIAVITRMFNEVPGGYSTNVTGAPLLRILSNSWLNVPAYWVSPQIDHYTSGSLLDPLTAILTILGFGLAIRWWARPICKLLVLWAVVSMAITALLSPYPVVAITRLLFAVPPLTILAALAARQIWRAMPWPARFGLASERTQRIVQAGAAAGLVVAVLGLNLYRFWVTTPRHMHLTQDAVVIGALRSGICGPESNRAIVVMRGHGLFRGAFNSYANPIGSERDLPQLITHDQLKPGEPIMLDSARCIIFGDPNDEPSRRAIDDITRAHPGGNVTRFSDHAGIAGVVIFRPAATTPR